MKNASRTIASAASQRDGPVGAQDLTLRIFTRGSRWWCGLDRGGNRIVVARPAHCTVFAHVHKQASPARRERTAQSTDEITSTIRKIQGSTAQVFDEMNQSVGRAKAGLTLSQQAGRTIAQLSSSSGEVLVAVQEISAALREQSQASNDIARHVESIAQMAQENSSAVEQTQHSARTLQSLAAELQASVMSFSV